MSHRRQSKNFLFPRLGHNGAMQKLLVIVCVLGMAAAAQAQDDGQKLGITALSEAKIVAAATVEVGTFPCRKTCLGSWETWLRFTRSQFEAVPTALPERKIRASPDQFPIKKFSLAIAARYASRSGVRGAWDITGDSKSRTARTFAAAARVSS